jgi:glc operon protein GlcG
MSVLLASRLTLTINAAKALAAAAIDEAVKNSWRITVAILDDGGNLMYLEKMDGCQTASINIAQQKALCALRFKRSTKVFSDALKEGNLNVLGLPGVVPVEGGMPILFKDEILGAIGISGVTSVQDAQIATAGLEVLRAYFDEALSVRDDAK